MGTTNESLDDADALAPFGKAGRDASRAADDAGLTALLKQARAASESDLGDVIQSRDIEVSSVERALAARVVLAERALAAIPGRSSDIVGLRLAAWRALFGPSLAGWEARAAVLDRVPIVVEIEPGPTRTALLAALAWGRAQPDRNGVLERSPLAILPASVAAADQRDLVFGVDKGLTHSGTTRRGLAEVGAGGFVVVEAPGALDEEVASALLAANERGNFRRRGDGRDRAWGARLVFVGDLPPCGAPTAVFRLRLSALRSRPEDVAAVAAAAAIPLGLAASALPGATELLRVANSAPAGADERAVVASIGALLTGAEVATPGAPAPAPSWSLPPTIRDGHASFEDVKAWYARHVRRMCTSDLDASARLGIHRATLAKYVRAADSAFEAAGDALPDPDAQGGEPAP